MSTLNDPAPEKQPMPQPTAPPGAADVESQPTGVGAVETSGFGVSGMFRRWRREDLMKKGSLTLRALALLFSLLSFIIMGSNKHGDWKDFDRYEEYRYVLAIAILSTLYTGFQSFKQVHQLSTGKEFIAQRTSALIDFFGDQVTAYLLVSSASAAVPLTNRMREGNDNLFTDSSAAAIAMSFFAFLALAPSALISGYKLSVQSSYI